MKRVWQCLAVVGLCGITCAAGYLATPQRQSSASQPSISLRIDPEQLNFGEVWENEAFPCSFSLHNDGQLPIEIENITTSCTCVRVEPRKFTVPPGGAVQLHAVVNHTIKQQADGGVAVALTATLKNPDTRTDRRVVWQLTGSVRRVLLIGKALSLGKQSELATLEPWIFPLESAEPLTEVKAESDIPELTAKVVASDESGCKFQLVVTPPQRLAPREIDGKITLIPNSRRHGNLPQRTVRLLGEIASDARSDPSEILIPGRLLGETIEETVAISSITNREWKIVSIATEGDGLTAEPMGTGAIRVRQAIRLTGRQTNQVTVVVATEKDRSTLLIPITYTGLQTEK